MKASTLVIFISWITSAAAFGVVGAYERLFLWYAYSLDVNNQYIATKCRGCTFAQFIDYITLDNDKSGTKTSAIAKSNPDNIRDLLNGGYDKGYNCARLWTDIHNPNDVAGTFSKVSKFVRDKVGAQPQLVKENVLLTASHVYYGRMSANADKVISLLEGQGLKVASQFVAVDEAAVDKTLPPNVNSGELGYGNYYRMAPVMTASLNQISQENLDNRVQQMKAADPGHFNNAQASMEMYDRLKVECRA